MHNQKDNKQKFLSLKETDESQEIDSKSKAFQLQADILTLTTARDVWALPSSYICVSVKDLNRGKRLYDL